MCHVQMYGGCYCHNKVQSGQLECQGFKVSLDYKRPSFKNLKANFFFLKPKCTQLLLVQGE